MKFAKPAAIAGATLAAVTGVLVLNPTQSTVSALSRTTTSGQSVGTTSTSGTTSGSGSTSSSGSSSSSSSRGTKTVTGAAASSPYGDMQVQATITNGKITAIKWVSLPSDGHSQRINSYAAPALVQQALTAQSANVDGVSGASYTTDGFRTSLQSALTQAGFTS
ncbi:FMN-binding domain-containing protein [Raineyella antarctica]|uniref:FMN-binding domain-containing protein n=1 Tax=Raineyella antarctica TaxID=1577474 RepID=A0A1G6H3D6_9ACTN|nr:FMN-binding protein [Raineyella antarctica]SDB88664.1 FMN-binding domain-containing protein [Raineyella antarctica]